MKQCYICKKEAKHVLNVSFESYELCDNCNDAYEVAAKALKEARHGLYLVN